MPTAPTCSARAGAPADLADRPHAAWTAFIRDGDPGWPRYDLTARTAAVIDEQGSTITGTDHGDRVPTAR
ncbi:MULTISPECIES: hypothetical protein [unclassified Streptomyces]|uniref:hypothetical protein n=1 Tax=unclassified Streptomyces TaxID=2593676 RepID=UPI00403C74C2